MVDTDRRRLAVQGLEMTMSQYAISSKAGVSYGVYEGDTPEAAFAAMVADGCGEIGDESVGTMDDWIVRPCGAFVVEGMGLRGWSRDYVEAGGDAGFDTEADALAAIDDLVATCGWSRDDLRVRAA